MITAHVETMTDSLEELKQFFDPHWGELALDKHAVPLDPLYEIYEQRENAGQLLLVVLREAGKICAYFVGFIAPGLHYRSCLTLTMDLFWVAPEFRDTDSLGSVEREMLCNQLFEAVEKEGRRRGVQRVFYGSKIHRDASAMFERMGLVEVERYFSAYWGAPSSRPQ